MSIHRLCEATLEGSCFPRFGDGTQLREFTYVEDIVAANLLAADAALVPGTVLNVAGGGEITLNGLISLVAELAGAPVVIEDHSAQAGDASRNGGSVKRARALLGWRPRVSLRDGIAAQLAWHRDRQRLLR
jgi:nucleoside-diphosphate-sugar epimerase